MGSRAWHIARAEHNYKAAEHLKQTEFTDWALTALFYSALHHVHSSLADQPGLYKDERHPRKHSAPRGAQYGGRGVNQLVRDLYEPIHVDYISLFELSMRTRYESKLITDIYERTHEQWEVVRNFCRGINQGRPTIPTSAP